jgi:hypothetical protein
MRREGRIVELAPDGEEDDEVDELAGEDEDEHHRHPSVPHHAHTHRHGYMRTPDTITTPPQPKKKLFGFEPDSTAGAIWSSHKTPR